MSRYPKPYVHEVLLVSVVGCHYFQVFGAVKVCLCAVMEEMIVVERTVLVYAKMDDSLDDSLPSMLSSPFRSFIHSRSFMGKRHIRNGWKYYHYDKCSNSWGHHLQGLPEVIVSAMLQRVKPYHPARLEHNSYWTEQVSWTGLDWTEIIEIIKLRNFSVGDFV